MQYSEGRIGRIFMIRIDDGEDLLESIQHFVVSHEIRSGLVLFLGAFRQGSLVTGPQELVIPPIPHFEHITGGWEIFGIGTIYRGEGGPKIHYHMTAGKGKESITGCLRDKATIYLVIEAVLFEFLGIYGKKMEDPITGITLPILKKDMQLNEKKR